MQKVPMKVNFPFSIKVDEELSNWKPITLLNVAYKTYAKAFAKNYARYFRGVD
jgi:hypothetical protein